jgi:tetratricopeptide (TPR) repeat protein
MNDELKIMKKIIIFLGLFLFLFAQEEIELAENAKKAYESSDFETAISLYQKAIEKKSDNPKLWFNLGNAYFKAKQYDKAREAFAVSFNLKESSDLSDANYNLGNSYLFESKPDSAIAFYKKALELNDKNEDAKYNMELARAILKEKSKKEKKQQNKQQKQPPPPKPSEYAKKMYKKSMETMENGQFSEAKQIMEKALQTDPSVKYYQKYMKNLDEVVKILEN